MKALLIIIILFSCSCTSKFEKGINDTSEIKTHTAVKELSINESDNLDSLRYIAAYNYIINSAELDSFCLRYRIKMEEKTFCIKREVYKIRADDFNEIIEYQYGLDLPDKPWREEKIYPDKERYLKLIDSLHNINIQPYIYPDTIDFSYISPDDIDCNFKLKFSTFDKNRLQVNMPYGIQWINDDVDGKNFSSTGLRFTIFFSEGSIKIDKVFAYIWIT